MAQILSIYGLVAAVIISGQIKEKMPIHTGFMQFGAGLAVGLCGLAAGFAIGIIGDVGGERRIDVCSFTILTVSSRIHTAATSLRGNGSHSHLCRGLGLVRRCGGNSHAHKSHLGSHRVRLLNVPANTTLMLLN